MPHSQDRIPELDGLRGLLASVVAFSHIICWCGLATPSLPGPIALLWQDFASPSFAVDTFIILSGFVITFTLNASRRTFASYLRARFFRIYPVFLFCLLLGVATLPLTPFLLETISWRDDNYLQTVAKISQEEQDHLGKHLVWHLLMLHGILPEKTPPSSAALLVPAWSISVEWQFYLVAPFLLRWIRSGAILVGCGVVAYLFLATPLGSH